MARDSSGPKNEPNYSGAGTPSDAADLTEVATYAARVGNRRSDTSANRTSATGADVWTGLEWYETDTGLTYVYNAGWVLESAPDTGWITPTLAGSWTIFSGETPQYRRMGGVVYLRGRATSSGATSTAFTLPTGFRPISPVVWWGNNSATPLQGEVFANGNTGSASSTAATNFSFSSCPAFPADA